MDDATLLLMLKNDLQQLTNSNDAYLQNLLMMAAARIVEEGITLDSSVADGMLQVQYAAYLFRRRAAPDTTMPRFLRYSLNNRLFSQKGKVDSG